MASIVIKGLPNELHRRLADDAARSRRSMNQHVIHLLDQSLSGRTPPPPPPPVKLKAKLTQTMLSRAIAEGRE
jgi:plasmid stability protein